MQSRILVTMPAKYPPAAFELIENFPAYERAGLYLKRMILDRRCKSVADIGGGANPLLDDEFIREHNIRYCLIDKSGAELEKANTRYTKIEADATSDVFQARIGNEKFDLIFSHMFLEHIEKPALAHRNFYSVLNPGGRCVHIYPSPNNLPLTLNRVLPESISAYMVKLAQPFRKLDGSQRKFKAYYRMCGAPSAALTATFENMGYSVCRHTGYIGHTYYERIRPVAALERQIRRILHRLQLPMTSGCLLVLEKPSLQQAT